MGEELKIYKSKFATGILNSDFDLDNIEEGDTVLVFSSFNKGI